MFFCLKMECINVILNLQIVAMVLFLIFNSVIIQVPSRILLGEIEAFSKFFSHWMVTAPQLCSRMNLKSISAQHP